MAPAETLYNKSGSAGVQLSSKPSGVIDFRLDGLHQHAPHSFLSGKKHLLGLAPDGVSTAFNARPGSADSLCRRCRSRSRLATNVPERTRSNRHRRFGKGNRVGESPASAVPLSSISPIKNSGWSGVGVSLTSRPRVPSAGQKGAGHGQKQAIQGRNATPVVGAWFMAGTIRVFIKDFRLLNCTDFINRFNSHRNDSTTAVKACWLGDGQRFRGPAFGSKTTVLR